MLVGVAAAGSRARWYWADQSLAEGWRGRILGRGRLHVAAQPIHLAGSKGTGELGVEHRLVGRRWWGVRRRKRLPPRSRPLLQWNSRSSRCSRFPDWWNNTRPRSLACVTKFEDEKKSLPSGALVPAFLGRVAVDEEDGGDGGRWGRREEGGWDLAVDIVSVHLWRLLTKAHPRTTGPRNLAGRPSRHPPVSLIVPGLRSPFRPHQELKLQDMCTVHAHVPPRRHLRALQAKPRHT